jgi:hypothetical protein
LFTEEEEVAKFSSSNTACDAKHREEEEIEEYSNPRLTTTSRAVVLNIFRARIVLLFTVVALQLEIIAEEEVDIQRFPCAPPPKVEKEGFIFVAMLEVNKEAEEESIVIVRLLSIDYLFESALFARAVFVRFHFSKNGGTRRIFKNPKCRKMQRYRECARSRRALRPTRDIFFASERKKVHGRLVCA